MSSLSAGHATDVGRVRKMNQDSLAVVAPDELEGRVDGLFVVADGMGGRTGGEIASRITVETVPPVVREVLTEHNGAITGDAMVEALRESIISANAEVWKQARENPDLRGMGTTCVAALIRAGVAALGNVGDSRAYLLRGGELVQLTHDHSLVQEHVRAGDMSAEEARSSRFRNVITRAIGIAGSVEPEVELFDLEDGDTLLLCSDGLTNMVSEPEIASVLGREFEAQSASERLVAAANRHGGQDNITAVVVRYGTFVPSAVADALPDEIDEDQRRSDAGNIHERRGSGALTWVLALLVVGLAGALAYVGKDRFTFSASWPFLQERKARRAAIPSASRPALDFGALFYDPAKPLLNKPVRGEPVLSDAVGNVYVVTTETGKVLRVSPNGKWTSGFPWTVPATETTEDVHWAADTQGNLYKSSRKEAQIEKYAPTGERKAVIGDGEVTAPEGIAVDGQGNVYAVDRGRLLVFRARMTPRPNERAAQGRNHGAR